MINLRKYWDSCTDPDPIPGLDLSMVRYKDGKYVLPMYLDGKCTCLCLFSDYSYTLIHNPDTNHEMCVTEFGHGADMIVTNPIRAVKLAEIAKVIFPINLQYYHPTEPCHLYVTGGYQDIIDGWKFAQKHQKNIIEITTELVI